MTDNSADHKKGIRTLKILKKPFHLNISSFSKTMKGKIFRYIFVLDK